MQGLLILAVIIAIVIFLMRFILIAVIVFIAAMALMLLLANFGLLPGAASRRYGRIKRDIPRGGGQTHKTSNEEWRASPHEDVEVITLPETALHKDEDNGSNARRT
ncbi:MAG: hypothetical protein LBS53_00390 [Synergistaceae bacterium]|jgi:hypothetical protein|nr:hypothetical protein [Synergistaceae bacterium]